MHFTCRRSPLLLAFAAPASGCGATKPQTNGQRHNEASVFSTSFLFFYSGHIGAPHVHDSKTSLSSSTFFIIASFKAPIAVTHCELHHVPPSLFDVNAWVNCFTQQLTSWFDTSGGPPAWPQAESLSQSICFSFASFMFLCILFKLCRRKKTENKLQFGQK